MTHRSGLVWNGIRPNLPYKRYSLPLLLWSPFKSLSVSCLQRDSCSPSLTWNPSQLWYLDTHIAAALYSRVSPEKQQRGITTDHLELGSFYRCKCRRSLKLCIGTTLSTFLQESQKLPKNIRILLWCSPRGYGFFLFQLLGDIRGREILNSTYLPTEEIIFVLSLTDLSLIIAMQESSEG